MNDIVEDQDWVTIHFQSIHDPFLRKLTTKYAKENDSRDRILGDHLTVTDVRGPCGEVKFIIS